MTNRKSTKKALLTSVLALLLCFSMLVGTTFAWFTDSVESGVNQIIAGNLDVAVTHTNKQVTDKDIQDEDRLFKDVLLWEPGAVAYEKLTVKNLGTLALKYALSINFTNENTVNGYGLSTALKVAVVDGDVTSREAAIKAGEGKWQNLKDFTLTGTLEAGKNGQIPSESYTIVIYWEPGDDDNNWNVNNGKTTSDGEKYLHIDLGVKLVATQKVSESDSFGNDYDKDAAWTGAADTAWYNTTATEFVLDTAEELAGLAQLVNNGTDTFAGKTVKLGADIDLNNIAWTPIGSSSNSWNTKFNGKFIGTGYTISNLYVTGTIGLGLFGYVGSTAHIEGVTIDGAYVSGNDYVGAVMGSGYLDVNCLKNCTVKNATIIATPYLMENGEYDGGTKAGAVAGFAINGHVIGNTAENCKVYAFRDLGGIVGMLSGENHSVNATDNTVKDVTLTYVGVMGTYAEGKVNSNMNDIVGRVSNATVEGNTATNVTKNETGAIVITTDDELYAFAASVNGGNTYEGMTVLLGDDIDLNNTEWTPIGTSSNTFNGVFDGQGHTISNLYIPGDTTYVSGGSNDNYKGLFGYMKGGDTAGIKNLNIVNANVTGCLYVGTIVGRVYTGGVIENCHVTGNIDINAYSYAGGIVGRYEYSDGIFDCSVKGTADEVAIVNAEYSGATYAGGIVGFNTEPSPYVTIDGCTVEYVNIYGGNRLGGISGIAHAGVTVTNCTVSHVTIVATQTEAEAADTDSKTVGLIVGACQGSASNPTVFGNNTVIDSTATINSEEVTALYGTSINGSAALVVGAKNEDGAWTASNAAELEGALTLGGEVVLTADVEVSKEIVIGEGVTVTLDLNGKEISGGYQEGSTTKHIYPINNYGDLTIEGGTVTGRGIYNQDGATLTINNATVEAVDYNGGACVWSYGGEVYLNNATMIGNTGVVSSQGYLEINGGTYTCYSGIADDGTQITAPTYNIRAYDGLKITGGTFTSRHGVISVGGGECVIEEGDYTIEFASGTTSNVVYVYGDADLTINGGKFLSDNTSGKADSGAAVVVSGSDASVTINDGTFVGMNGMVSGNATLYGGTYNTVWNYNHYDKLEDLLAAGYTATQNEDGSWTVSATKVSTANDLQTALDKGESVILTEDVKTEAAAPAPYGNKVGIIQNGGTIDGNGQTLSVECYGDDYGIMTSGGTIKNLTIDSGCRAIMIMSPTEDIIIDNVYVSGDILYPINTGEHATVEGVDLIVTNSTFGGWSSFAGIASASFTNCTFIEGNYGYGWPYETLVKPYVNTIFTNCEFALDGDGKAYYLDLSALETGCTVTLNNCTVNGTVVTAENCTELFGEVELPTGRTLSDCVIFK